MNNSVTQIINALKPLATKLGEGAKFLYATYYRQVIISAHVELIIGTLAIVLIVATIIILWVVWGKKIQGEEWHLKYQDSGKKLAQQRYEDSKRGNVLFAQISTLVVGAALIFMLLGAAIIPGVQQLLNPNYYTIQDIISQATNNGSNN